MARYLPVLDRLSMRPGVTYTQHCPVSFPFLYDFSVSDFLLDIRILALSIPCIVRLNVPCTRRVAIVGVFLITLVGVFASGARILQYIQIQRYGLVYLVKVDEERRPNVSRCSYASWLS